LSSVQEEGQVGAETSRLCELGSSKHCLEKRKGGKLGRRQRWKGEGAGLVRAGGFSQSSGKSQKVLSKRSSRTIDIFGF
jgi:hypothetical protein